MNEEELHVEHFINFIMPNKCNIFLRREVGEGTFGNLGSADAHCQQQGPTRQGRSYNQYPVISHDRKEYEGRAEPQTGGTTREGAEAQAIVTMSTRAPGHLQKC